MTIREWVGIVLLATIGMGLPSGCSKREESEKGIEKRSERPGNALAKEESGLILLSPESQALAEIKTEEVMPRHLSIELEASGTIQVNENRLTRVGSRIPGRVIKVAAGLGDYMRSGDSLATVDSPELGQAQSEYLTVRAKLLVAKNAYERARRLVEGKVISTGEFQRREGEYRAIQAEGQASQARLQLLGMTHEEMRALESQNTIRSQVVIPSPLSGTVIGRDVTRGEMVEPARTLFTIADLSTLWGIAGIPEKDLSTIKKGLLTEVSVPAYPQERFKGKITYLSDIIDPSTRTLKVRIEVENLRGKLKPEMFASFRILTEKTEEKLVIQESAVQREGARTIVFVAHEGGSFEKRVVGLGRRSQDYYEVASGLHPGEKVVTKGAFALKSETFKDQMEAD